ncbi:hypothetical protein M0805_003528 [Coniferiporia weirii]|nr:hypothetical protein M0805_003528 [Coniferiporia weirii]
MDGTMRPKTQPRNIANAMPDSVGDTAAGARSVDHRLNLYRNSTPNGGRTTIVTDLRRYNLEVCLNLLIDNIFPLLRNRFEIDEIAGADGMTGRDTTRAFKVIQSMRTDYGLKDEDNRKIELEIHGELLENIKTFVGLAREVIARKHFLTPKYHSKIIMNVREDHTIDMIIRHTIPSFDNTFNSLTTEVSINDAARSAAPSRASEKGVHLGTRAPRNNTGKHIRHRLNYRAIFDKVAEPMKMMNLRGVLVSLKDCMKVLSYIHKAGWVHHDISCSNVYLYEGRGLLGDLEYANRIGTDGQREVRTGTLDFMAVEVTNHAYLYAIPLSSACDSIMYKARLSALLSKAKLQKEGRVDLEADMDTRIKAAATFFYNDLHDMESMWWIPIWMLFFHDNEAQRETDGLKMSNRSLCVRQLFPRNLNTSDRKKFLDDKKSFLTAVSRLPKSFAHLVEVLELLMDLLRGMYRDSEASLPKFDRDVYKNELHEFFNDTWDFCIDFAKNITLVPYRDSSAKRKATNAEFTDDIDESSPVPKA